MKNVSRTVFKYDFIWSGAPTTGFVTQLLV